MKIKKKPASDTDKALAKVGSSNPQKSKANTDLTEKAKENSSKPINYQNKPHIL